MATAKTLIQGRLDYLNELNEVRKQIDANHLVGRSIKKPLRPLVAKTNHALFKDNRERTSLLIETSLSFSKNKGKKLPAAAGKKLSKAMQPTKSVDEKVAEQGITA